MEPLVCALDGTLWNVSELVCSSVQEDFEKVEAGSSG